MKLPTVVLLCAALLLPACGTPYRDRDIPMITQADFDPARYLGTWFEIARFPVPFQRGCTATTATYGAVDADTISVRNDCRDGAPDGPLKTIEGTADIVGPGKLRVEFTRVPLIRAPYHVLFVDDAYQLAVVGVPNGRAGWILARSPQITIAQRAQAEAVLDAAGYDVSLLLDVPQLQP